MAKSTISFKPTPECERQIAELMADWNCDRTTMLIKAVGIAYAGGELPSQVKWANEQAERLKKERASVTTGGINREKLAAFQRKTGMDSAKARK